MNAGNLMLKRQSDVKQPEALQIAASLTSNTLDTLGTLGILGTVTLCMN